MRCEEVMTRPVEICRDYETVQVAARRMADSNIGFVPICDERGRLVGVLTDRDIAVRVAADDRTASETRIRDVMTREVVACHPSDEIAVAAARMAEAKKSRVIVTNGEIVGVISLADLAAIGEPHLPETLRSIASRERARARDGAWY